MNGQLINPNPTVIDIKSTAPSTRELLTDLDSLQPFEVFDIIRTIQDPEHPHTLEELAVVKEELVTITRKNDCDYVDLEYTPTVPHCTLATLIGLCLRVKLQRELPDGYKLDIHVSPGSHQSEDDINKQVNDKERICAALENPNLCQIVERCIRERG